jgi:hypothetical protein
MFNLPFNGKTDDFEKASEARNKLTHQQNPFKDTMHTSTSQQLRHMLLLQEEQNTD